MKKTIYDAFLAIVSLGLVALSMPQEPGAPVSSQSIQPSTQHEVMLSSTDKAVLHTSFLMGPVGVASGMPGPVRTLSFACHVTVDEVWESSLVHGIDCVDLNGSREVMLGAGWNDEYRTIRVSPLPGMSWGDVKGTADLSFAISKK